MNSHQVGVAAEAFAACILSQAGCDVSIQYGANRPGYDVVALASLNGKESAILISVKGTKENGWGLIQSYKIAGRTYAEAADAWLAQQREDIIFMLISFYEVKLETLPRAYLASAKEIADHHKASRGGEGHTSLCEDRIYTKGVAKGVRDQIPSAWKFSRPRLDSFLAKPNTAKV